MSYSVKWIATPLSRRGVSEICKILVELLAQCPGCQPGIQQRLRGACRVSPCQLTGGRAGQPVWTERAASVLQGNLSRGQILPGGSHPCLSLHFQGNWLPWVETGPRYQGPEDPALGSWERQGRTWGVAWRHPWQGPVRLAWHVLESRLVKGSQARTVSSGCRGISVGVPTYGPWPPSRAGFSVWQQELAGPRGLVCLVV